MVDMNLLSDVELFRALSPEAFEQVAGQARPRSLRRGDVLFAEGDIAEELFVVETGRIAIANRSIDGRESVVALMEPGDVFGEMPLFDGIVGRSAHARALEASQVYAVSYAPLRDIFERKPELLWGVVDLLARRLRTMNVALADSAFLDVTGRTPSGCSSSRPVPTSSRCR